MGVIEAKAALARSQDEVARLHAELSVTQVELDAATEALGDLIESHPHSRNHVDCRDDEAGGGCAYWRAVSVLRSLKVAST
jgi:hypothetical protein